MQDGVDRGVGEAALDGLLHHLRAVAAVAGVGLADPDVDGAVAGVHAAPVLGLLVLRVDDLDEADGPAVDLGDEPFAPGRVPVELGLPVPVGVDQGVADVGSLVPAAQGSRSAGAAGRRVTVPGAGRRSMGSILGFKLTVDPLAPRTFRELAAGLSRDAWGCHDGPESGQNSREEVSKACCSLVEVAREDLVEDVAHGQALPGRRPSPGGGR